MDSNTTGLSASSTLGGPKFKIHQSIPSGSVKRGPHAIVRSVELNDCIEIQRRCGGKYLCQISSSTVNFCGCERADDRQAGGYTNDDRDNHSYNLKYSSNTKTDKYRRKDKSKSRTPSPKKKKPVKKVPYRDEQHEKDRLKRLYGRSCSPSPPPTSRSSARKYSPITKRRIESRDRHRKYSPHRSSRKDYRTHSRRQTGWRT